MRASEILCATKIPLKLTEKNVSDYYKTNDIRSGQSVRQMRIKSRIK